MPGRALWRPVPPVQCSAGQCGATAGKAPPRPAAMPASVTSATCGVGLSHCCRPRRPAEDPGTTMHCGLQAAAGGIAILPLIPRPSGNLLPACSASSRLLFRDKSRAVGRRGGAAAGECRTFVLEPCLRRTAGLPDPPGPFPHPSASARPSSSAPFNPSEEGTVAHLG